MNLIYGQTPVSAGPYPEILEINYEVEKPRVRRFQRFQPGPAAVHKVRYLLIPLFHLIPPTIKRAILTPNLARSLWSLYDKL